MSKKLRVAQFNASTNSSVFASYDDAAILINKDGGLYLGNSTTTPKLIADKADGKYLPLSGGTLTGTVYSQSIVPRGNNTYNLGASGNKFKTVYAGEFNGNGLVLGGNNEDRNIMRISCVTNETVDSISNYGFTLKFLGSGSGVNNALALYGDNVTSASQNLATKWLNDGTMYSRAILPHHDQTYNLGSSNYKWYNVYATNFKGKADTATTADTASALTNDCVLSDDEITDIVTQYFELNFISSGSGSGDGISMALEDESNTPEEVSEA